MDQKHVARLHPKYNVEEANDGLILVVDLEYEGLSTDVSYVVRKSTHVASGIETIYSGLIHSFRFGVEVHIPEEGMLPATDVMVGSDTFEVIHAESRTQVPIGQTTRTTGRLMREIRIFVGPNAMEQIVEFLGSPKDPEMCRPLELVR
ncbi:hypothetical protein CO174_02480 [Candidatus Uhrbacteria bacterium CG_4_9_14_3_um_filter_50_9]|uniref:Uncharacterized protein n=1 Tax=Candidatus Uhrbacteria bacterium CG_4_9_14_3_um_filter_50_9 TaxID=1975035 RepID=A0A2M7XCD4_9BACT|nr:MAG: hypothetical protein CO174_02480 [Candidatus Uhrbacteria bacterium CG_4_9_14_3_um_filter_50_9]